MTGVPNYSQWRNYNYNGKTMDIVCQPTSMANILAYHDSGLYPNLVPSGSDRELYTKVNIFQALQAAGGYGLLSSIDPAFDFYIAANGNYNYSGISLEWPSVSDYEKLQAEIYAFGLPCLIGFPVSGPSNADHMTTGVGYDKSSGTKMVIVHDNHVTVPVYQAWADVNYIFSCTLRTAA